ncbi:MAG: hypothetical protein ABWY04_01190 [Arthrobacter sp.]
MQALANFIGELGGESWTTQAVALILASILALAAAVVTAIVTVNQGNANRKAAVTQADSSAEQERLLEAREHWWLRFKAVSDDLTSDNEMKREVALVLMDHLASSAWADDKDKLMIVSVLEKAKRPEERKGKWQISRLGSLSSKRKSSAT